MTGPVVVERQRGVVVVRLHRPDQMNALSAGLIRALRAEIASVRRDPTARVVVLTGDGRAFSAGADLKEASEALADPLRFRAVLRTWRDTFLDIERLDLPVIAGVNGVALAGGLELALACDLIVAGPRARLGDAHINYGLVPGGGGSQRLVDAVGPRFARWMMYTGALLGPDEARSVGLVQHVLADDDFDSRLVELAVTIATRSPDALSFMKRMTGSSHTTVDALDHEIESAIHVITAPNAREGFAAFVAGRRPVFSPNRTVQED